MVGGVSGRVLNELMKLVGGQEGGANILHIHKAFQKGQQVEELRVGLIIIPALDGNAIGELVPERLLASTIKHLKAWRDMLTCFKTWHLDCVSDPCAEVEPSSLQMNIIQQVTQQYTSVSALR